MKLRVHASATLFADDFVRFRDFRPRASHSAAAVKAGTRMFHPGGLIWI